MAVQLVLRNGTSAENDAFTGAVGEVTVDTTNNSLRVHDGTTAGGSVVGKDFTAGTGITLSNNEFSIGQSVGTGDNVTFNTVTSNLTGDVTGTVSDISNHDTDDLSEGSSNLYYTDARTRAALSASGDLTYNSSTGEFSVTVPAGYDSSDFDTDFSGKSTDDLSEGTTNLYYLDTRVDTHLSGGTGVDYNTGTISIGQSVGTTDNVTFNDVVVDGDLVVNGTTTTLNTSTLEVEDINITFASGATDSASADGAGLTIDGANATLTYSNSSDRLVFNKDIEATTLVGQVSDISNHDTDDLSEGTTNLYYTDARVDAHLTGGNGIDFSAGTIAITANGVGTDELDVAGTGSAGEALLSDGDGSFSFGAAGATITDDSSTNSNFYPTLTDSTSGSFTAATISSTKLFFNPSSGTLNATTFNSLSDERQKKNIETLDSALDKTLSLRGVSFTYNDTDIDSIGVIAQEIEKVIPEVVSTGSDGFKSVSYGNIVGLLIEAIKEQQNEINELKSKVYK